MKRFPWPLFGLTAFTIVLVQYGFATAGTWRFLITDDFYTTYHYDQLADAFRTGQLHFRFDPPAALVQMPDPYEPAIWHSLGGLYETTLYQGRYYLYYGPVPALLLTLLKLFAPGLSIPDSVAVLLFTLIIGIASTAISGTIWWRWYRDTSPLIATAGSLVAGLGLPVLFVLGRPAFYEAAIAGSQAFFLAGLFFLLQAFRRDDRSAPLFAAASVCWALALGCRLTIAPSIGIVVLAALVWIRRSDWSEERWRQIAALLVPVAVGVALIGIYNALRFGSPFETGLRFILTGSNFRRDFDTVFSASYVVPNAYNLLIRSFDLLPVFPYVTWTPLARELMPSWTAPPARMYLEPVVGILPSQPFFWFLVASPFLLLDSGSGRTGDPFRPRSLFLTLLIAVTAGGIATMAFHVATMRYLVELGPLLTILATISTLALARRTSRFRPVIVAVVLVGAGASILISALLGVEGYFGHLRTHNPDLYARLGAKRVAESDIASKNARARFGDVVELIGYRLEPSPLRQGDNLTLVLWWRAITPGGSDDEIHLKLLNRELDLFYERRLSPVSGTYPFSRWTPGEVIEDHHRFSIPIDSDLPDELFFEVSVETRAGQRALPIRDPAGQDAGTIFRTSLISLSGYKR